MEHSLLCEKLSALTSGVPYRVTNLAGAAAILYSSLDQINWAGFYLYRDGQLVVGPYQGKPACIYIPLGRGVCGTAAERRETVVVPDVHQFPGHIACDSASRSEIVIPLTVHGELYGVLDIDSPIENRFSEDDRLELETFANFLTKVLEKEGAV